MLSGQRGTMGLIGLWTPLLLTFAADRLADRHGHADEREAGTGMARCGLGRIRVVFRRTKNGRERHLT